MFGIIKGLLSSGDTLGTIAKSYIKKESGTLEAKSLMIKALDPNGILRREISTAVKRLYMLYMITLFILTLYLAFGKVSEEDAINVKFAIESLTELFLPITGMFTTIVYASYGVNAYNIKKGK